LIKLKFFIIREKSKNKIFFKGLTLSIHVTELGK
jgi:hypothetical protein